MLQSLLSSPEPKDPQDAEVASMMLKNPQEFEHKAREWAVKFAGAPRKEEGEGSGGATPQTLRKARELAKERDAKAEVAQCVHGHATICLVALLTLFRYHGYNRILIDRFCDMGFDVQQVVSAFEYVGIDHNDGEDYELEERYMGDITARLFGEP
jgi:ubiquitin-conjugating enzyme (huntingtin interacting protein 2)